MQSSNAPAVPAETGTGLPWLATYREMGVDWHTVPPVPDKTLSDYLRDHAGQFPEREALVFMGQGLTYRELDAQIDRMAALLTAQGCRKGDVLGLHLPNMPQYVVAFGAAARLGMVCTSISPLMTPTEVAHQGNDARVRVLLTLQPLWEQVIQHAADNIRSLDTVLVSGPGDYLGAPFTGLKAQVGERVRVLSLADQLASAGQAPAPVRVSLDDVLYLQYTGGTTGAPKGARLTSANLFTNNIQADVFYGYRLGQETVASAFPLFHIGGAAVLFNALRTASTFLLIPDPRDIAHFVGEMQKRTPTIIAAVPALYQMLCQHEGFRGLDFSQLRTAVSGAAPFAREDIERLAAIIGENKFCEVYGMTETSPVQTLNPARRFKPGSVGVPLPGTRVRIVDTETGKQMSAGEPGEVTVAGPQVMSGYLAMPDATADALRQHDGLTWMYTGDIGYLDDEGYLTICDRSKDMLIVGGYKVFSVEVENTIQALSWVALCAVVGRADEQRPGNDIVQLYVQALPGDMRDEEARRNELMGRCRERLSPYKVPREIFIVEAIPLTSVGKIDKKALRKT
ncbi:AMP-binding protein [Isoalcanivorax indicus]|uniref:AMP-binding protein n=1 Tax=Isoalcanivorax indicus TaxID=2202653 RepID=UPI001FEA9C0A|nr:AMP-binding protein [Isoalcanivorax indicus]